MRTWFIIGGVILILVVVGIVFGIPYLRGRNVQPPVSKETEVALGDLGEISETPEIAPGELVLGETGDQTPVPATKETTGTEKIPLETGQTPKVEGEIEPVVSGKTPGTTAARGIAPQVSVTPERPTRPAARVTSRPATQPTQPPESPVIETGPEITPSPIPTTSEATPTPAPAPVPPQGNYSVRTIEPVFESRLAAVRKAMEILGVQLTEQKTGQRQLSASRIAVGYFRTKAEAESWAQSNFRPRGIAYYIYPAQGMFSIQVGIYAQQQNVELAMRELDRKFQGWRLPVRTETVTIPKSAYELSISRITESLARKVQDSLFRMGIQTEITGM
jgi:hypothetical protein